MRPAPSCRSFTLCELFVKVLTSLLYLCCFLISVQTGIKLSRVELPVAVAHALSYCPAVLFILPYGCTSGIIFAFYSRAEISKSRTAELLTIDTFPSGKQQASVIEMSINATVYSYFCVVPSKVDVRVYNPEAQLNVLVCTEVSNGCFSFLCCFGD